MIDKILMSLQIRIKLEFINIFKLLLLLLLGESRPYRAARLYLTCILYRYYVGT